MAIVWSTCEKKLPVGANETKELNIGEKERERGGGEIKLNVDSHKEWATKNGERLKENNTSNFFKVFSKLRQIRSSAHLNYRASTE